MIIPKGVDPEVWSQECPECKYGWLHRVWRKAPAGRIGGEGSDRQIKSMQKSFRERFFKKGIDDVRHKHGSAIDESIRGAEIDRIKG